MDGQLIDEAVDLVRSRWDSMPLVGIILGTGLGGLVEDIEVEEIFEFDELPGFVPATALGHRGRLVCGRLDGKPLVVLDGRLHHYEGHDAGQITLGVHLFHRLGAGGLIVSNASGGVNPELTAGDLLVMESHINLMFLQVEDPSSSHQDRAGRMLADPYHPAWIETALGVALETLELVVQSRPALLSGFVDTGAKDDKDSKVIGGGRFRGEGVYVPPLPAQ